MQTINPSRLINRMTAVLAVLAIGSSFSSPAPGGSLTETRELMPLLSSATVGAATVGAPTSANGRNSSYPCNGTTRGYNAIVIKSGSVWTVTHHGTRVAVTTDMYTAMEAGWNSLTPNRTTKESVLVQGSGDIAANVRKPIPNYTILNICGTINVTGVATGDYAPIYARDGHDIDIPNLRMTGNPVYGMLFRNVDRIRLGQIHLQLSSSAKIGIRVDNKKSGGGTTKNQKLTIDYVYGSGMASHVVETYGINDIAIGRVEASNIGECGILLNNSTNVNVAVVRCNNCGAGTGYAAFRIANTAGLIDGAYPTNIRVGRVEASGGGRGVFCVSGSGGLVIESVVLSNTGNSSILVENCNNVTIAARSGLVNGGGEIRIAGASTNVTLQNLTVNSTTVRERPCSVNTIVRNVNLVGGATMSICQ